MLFNFKICLFSFHTNIEELEKSQAVLLDYLANAGCLRQMQSLRDRDLLVQDIVMFQVIHRVQGPFHRFCEGLTTLGVLQKIRSHPDSFRPLFCYQPCVMTADQMENLFSIRLSPEGSNKRAAEETILAFATGASVVPAIGFSPTPSVQFMHNEDDDFFSSMFPMANTCVNCIKLPLHTSYQLFREKFDFALGNTHGFGRA
uniref:HECT domain-containing protein n=1 Tax=Oryzias sinensis TaxID=183150 RepID=A0A8C7WXR4_9TELE